MVENAGTVSREVFALTDEQIVGLQPEEAASAEERSRSLAGARDENRRMEGIQDAQSMPRSLRSEPLNARLSGRDDGIERVPRDRQGARREWKQTSATNLSADGKGAQARVPGPQEVPEWLAERMQDLRHGGEAKEFWDGKQRAEKEAAAYREVFATPEDARALKEIYPGGVSEAKSAAERARTLDEIDAAFYRGDAAARMQLAQRMMAQDPAAFREIVEAGVRLLNVARDARPVTREEGNGSEPWFESGAANVEVLRDAKDASPRMTRATKLEVGQLDGGVKPPLQVEAKSAQALRDSRQAGVPVPQEVVRAYGEFERSANGELEKSVGGAIARAMEQALPNLRTMRARPSQLRASGADAAPLQERLAGAVREEVEAALKSDRQLGEQVARILAGKRFDAGARGQVVRLIDARAQQLVPEAVKRVVGAWTQTTLAAHGKTRNATGVRVEAVEGSAPRVEIRRRETRTESARKEMVRAFEEPPTRRGPRVDYGRFSDEEIVGL